MVVETLKKLSLLLVCLVLPLPVSGCSQKELIDENPDVPFIDEADAAKMLNPEQGSK